jgi:hypothetical protein
LSWLRWLNLALAVLTVLAPTAHVLELPNKLALDANLWLAVQQHLYRSWGPLLGGSTEIGALVTSLILAYARRRSKTVLWPTLISLAGYACMIAIFFVLNLPVNTAVASWTATTLPPNWADFRLRWEAGHAFAFLLSLISLAALIRALAKERQRTGGRASGVSATI